MSLRKTCTVLRQSLEQLVPALASEADRDTCRRAINLLDTIRHTLHRLLIECPNCNGACGFTIHDERGQVDYRPCGYCHGLGHLPRQEPEPFRPPAPAAKRKK